MKTNEMFEYERNLLNSGKKYICGVDEVGRGPLAGPVTVCAVIMDLTKPMIEGVNDSKKLTPKKRDELFDKIIENSIAYSIVSKDENRIDEVNILNATKEAMVEAINSLSVKPEHVLVDAVKLDISYDSTPIIKGDSKSYSIACASILAKVTRDRFMEKISGDYPLYNFAKHKGYGTKEHIDAIKKYGICNIHRKSFVKNFVGDNEN